MEIGREDALFVVRHQVTEDDLQCLEKGTRILGRKGGGRKVLTILLVIAVICLAVKGLFEGIAGVLLSALGGALFLIVLAGFYVLTKGDIDSRQDMKRKYQENIADYQMEREYRFYEEYYEVISEYEYARFEYDCLGRLFDMSGMFVLLEKGDVIRFFQKNAIKKGDAVEFAAFLERKCERTIETVSLGK